MPEPSAPEVTQLLLAWSAGDQSALEKLAPLVHQELHRLAKAYMSRERPGHTLQTTALVNEAYLRLVNVKISRHTVVREWNSARAWLYHELSGGHKDESSRDKPRQDES